MSESPSDELLARYFANEASPVERREVEQWIAAAPSHATEFDLLQQRWTAGGAKAMFDVDRAWAAVAPRLTDAATVTPLPVRRPFITRQWIRIAAVTALIVSGGIFMRQRFMSPIPATNRATGDRQQQAFTLTDGTQVVLAPNSSLETAAGFGRESREVTLRGEAWFEVHHDSAIPFRVHAGNAIIEDIGTSFSIQALPTATQVRVVMVEGRASLRSASDSALLTAVLRANDVAILPIHGAINVAHDVTVSGLVSWRTGSLAFQGRPMFGVLADLSRWYAITFRFEDEEKARQTFTGTLPTSNLTEVLEIIATSLGVRAEQHADTVTFR